MMEPKEKIPVFKSWKGWYIFVLLFLLVLIAFFQWLTKNYA